MKVEKLLHAEHLAVIAACISGYICFTVYILPDAL
jgi:hypothetical protein